MKMGALLDLTSFVQSDAAALGTINKRIMDIYTIEGKTYGIPMLSIGSFLYYNKELFDKAGIPYPTTDWNDQSWDYQKMLGIAQKLTHDVGDADKQVFGVRNSMSLTFNPGDSAVTSSNRKRIHQPSWASRPCSPTLPTKRRFNLTPI